MDPNHRDRLAFIKIVSGTFERNKPYLHVRNNKKLKFSSPNAFFAEKKEIVDISYPGDIVGLHDTGNFKIGDSLTGEKINFKGILAFHQSIFDTSMPTPWKPNNSTKALTNSWTKVSPNCYLSLNNCKVIGTVGALQFDVIQYRLEHEYGAKCAYENLNVHKACWVEPEDETNDEFTDFKRVKQKFLAKDKAGQLVFLPTRPFLCKWPNKNILVSTFIWRLSFK